MFDWFVGLDTDTVEKLALYAALTHQSVEQAAQSILREFLETTGSVRISHHLDKALDLIDQTVKQASQEAVPKIS